MKKVFFIVEINDCFPLVKKEGFKQFKRAFDKKNEYENKHNEKLEIIDQNELFVRGNVDVVVQNIITKKPVTIKKSQLGTCCDPSTERYHCM